MDDAGYSTDFLTIVAALAAVPLTWERVALGDKVGGASRDWMRIAFVVIVALNAWADATHWRHVLYGTLMPLGAYFLVRALVEPVARWKGSAKVDS